MAFPDTLVLVGPMGAGKTSIGRRVAKRLGVPFTDTDATVVRAHGPVPVVFETYGEAGFRRLERQAVQEALSAPGVVALGGGAVLDPDTRADLSRYPVALLTVSPAIVAGRLRGGARPLLAGGDAVARWQEIYQARRPLYEEVADETFDTSSGPLNTIVDAVAAWARRSAAPGSRIE